MKKENLTKILKGFLLTLTIGVGLISNVTVRGVENELIRRMYIDYRNGMHTGEIQTDNVVWYVENFDKILANAFPIK